MNLRDRVGKTFSDFWNINLGHVGIIVTFVFGLGIAYQRISDNILRVDDRVTIKHEAALSAIAVTANERDLKFAALTERIVRDEAQVSMIADLKINIAVIGNEMRNLTTQLSGIRQELHDRKPE